MDKYQRGYPKFSLCGLNCGLCPRFNTVGTSKCPGCGGEDFQNKHPSCAIISCSRKHESIQFCCDCPEFPCSRYKDIPQKDSFITYKNVISDFCKFRKNGIEIYKRDLDRKTDYLELLLTEYNDDRSKNFYCVAVNLLEIDDVESIVERTVNEKAIKTFDKSRRAKYVKDLFLKVAGEKGIDLDLRK